MSVVNTISGHHFQMICRSKYTDKTQQIVNEDDDDYFLRLTQDQKQEYQKSLKITLKLNGVLVDFQIDTEANITIISPATHIKIGNPP